MQNSCLPGNKIVKGVATSLMMAMGIWRLTAINQNSDNIDNIRDVAIGAVLTGVSTTVMLAYILGKCCRNDSQQSNVNNALISSPNQYTNNDTSINLTLSFQNYSDNSRPQEYIHISSPPRTIFNFEDSINVNV